MTKRLLSFLLSFLLVFTGFIPYRPLSAQEKQAHNIAVLDLIANGVSESEGLTLSENLRSMVAEIISSDDFAERSDVGYTIVERSQMDRIFDQFDIQNTGCTDVECAVEFGKMLSVDQIVIGSVGLVGETYSIQARIIDVESSRILNVSNETYKGLRDNLLTAVVPDVAYELMYGAKRKSSKKLYYIIGGIVLVGGAVIAGLSGGSGGGDSGGGEGTAVIDIILDE